MSNSNQDFVGYYNRYKDKIYAYFLYRVSFDKKTAEDLTSEVFIKAFKGFRDFDATKSFQAWIYAIARNHLINYYKKASRERPLNEADNLSCDSATGTDNRLELERVVKIIHGLGEPFKEPLLMRFVEGLSNSEIAHLLDKAEGAVRIQISRGLKKLRKLLKK